MSLSTFRFEFTKDVTGTFSIFAGNTAGPYTASATTSTLNGATSGVKPDGSYLLTGISLKATGKLKAGASSSGSGDVYVSPNSSFSPQTKLVVNPWNLTTSYSTNIATYANSSFPNAGNAVPVATGAYGKLDWTASSTNTSGNYDISVDYLIDCYPMAVPLMMGV